MNTTFTSTQRRDLAQTIVDNADHWGSNNQVVVLDTTTGTFSVTHAVTLSPGEIPALLLYDFNCWDIDDLTPDDWVCYILSDCHDTFEQAADNIDRWLASQDQ